MGVGGVGEKVGPQLHTCVFIQFCVLYDWMEMKTIIHAVRAIWNASVDIHIGYRDEDRTLFRASPLSYVEVPSGEASMVSDAAISLRYEEAQLLIDELWGAGLRPSEGTGSAGSLAATERHLKDLQELVKVLLQRQ